MQSNPFIALEAEDEGYDDLEDTYSDVDEQAPFLAEDDDDLQSLPRERFAGLSGLEDDEDDPFEMFLERLKHLPCAQRIQNMRGNRIPPLPSDTPLWKVQCHTGQQKQVLLYLFNRTRVLSQYPIQSIIARAFAPSWLYLETAHALTSEFSQYLLSVPGVVVTRGHPVVQLVAYEEWLRVLAYDRHDTLETAIPAGPWICLKAPPRYEGDLGLVFEGEHKRQVLVIPRIQDDRITRRTHTQTRCTASLIRPSLRLFERREHSVLGAPVLLDGDENRVLYGGDLYEYGLLVLDYDKVAGVPASEITSAVESRFLMSGHPLLEWKTLPHPFQWQFLQGDRVTVRMGGGVRRTGYVQAIEGRRSLVVDFDGGEGQECVAWRQVTKKFEIGNAVECLSGAHKGKAGLVMEIIGSVISFSEDLKKILVEHANMLRLVTTPPPTLIDSLATVNVERVWPLTTLASSSTAKAWQKVYHIGDRVALFRGASKGSFATVQGERMDDVLVRSGTYGPSTSFKLFWVPKDHVISEGQYRGPFHIERVPSPEPRSDTPPPSEPSVDVPAWNPQDDEFSLWKRSLAHSLLPPANSMNEQVRDSVRHWALDSAFSNSVFRVAIKPRETNEVPVFQKITADGLAFVRDYRSEQRTIEISDIVWKHPRARETGRMIVIVGLHKGSYVRPIQCQHSAVGDDDTWEVIVIEVRGKSESDVPVGPKLMLETSELVLGWQDEEEKTANKELATSLKRGPQRPSRKKIRTQ